MISIEGSGANSYSCLRMFHVRVFMLTASCSDEPNQTRRSKIGRDLPALSL